MSGTAGCWALIGLLLPSPGCRQIRSAGSAPDAIQVWAIGDGEAIERDAAVKPGESGVWDGTRVRLFGGRNEVLAFQLIVRASSSRIHSLRVELPALVHEKSGSRIRYAPPAADPSDSRGREIQVFSVHYVNVTQPTRVDWIFNPGGPDAPADPTGWKPNQLVPENARPGRGGFPLSVAARQNQALWFEIYTGRQRPAGIYRGTLTVTADQRRIAVPVELELLDFTLPDDNALTAMVYYEPSQPELYQGRNLDAVYHRFAHRQRIELTHGYDLEGAQAALGRFTGQDFQPAQGYDGPGAGVGNRIIPASFYDPGPGWQDRATAWRRADAWMGFLDRHLPGAITFLYMPDEPGPEVFPQIRAIAANLHANPGVGRRLPVFVTHEVTDGLRGAVDIWCSTSKPLDPEEVARERAAGRQHWFYNGGRPHGPATVIDAPPTDLRIIGWMAAKAQVPVYFYWHAVHWKHNHQKKIGRREQNVWAEPITFDSRTPDGGGEWGNGEGVLLYPGTDRLHPDQDRGIEGPISTLRLANLRRGLQDHLYLTLAARRGQQQLVRQVLADIVPRVFSQARGRVSFPERTEAFEEARRKLARALAAATPATPATPP
jgi:hypothetical protein